MMLIADKQLLCGSCAALVALGWTVTIVGSDSETKYPRLVVKDCYVVSGEDNVLFCNEECKRKVKV